MPRHASLLPLLATLLHSAAAFSPGALLSPALRGASLAASSPRSSFLPHPAAAASPACRRRGAERQGQVTMFGGELLAGIMGKSVIFGGALAGGLHAVSGPDHFPALLPRCMGKSWFPAAKIGSLWGFGHGLSAMAMGLAFFLVKDKALHTNKYVANVVFGADVAIGISLIFIGLLSLQEAKGRDFTKDLEEGAAQKSSLTVKMSMVVNGMFHGLSLDGIPTLLPVIGLGSLKTAITFLVAYGAGVTVAMMMATVFIGKGTMSLAQSTDFNLGRLIKGSAFAAIAIGVLWTLRAVFLPESL